MIKTKTLFILGAGASKPFGYPTGDELRHQILFSVAHDDGIVKAYNTENDPMVESMHRKSFNEFKQQFERSGDYSIDSFLEHRPEFMDIGKIFIAKVLISYEQDNSLRKAKDNWYMYLLDRIKAPFGELCNNNISFITFNYDRSLEYFLFEAIKSKSGRGASECAEKMKHFPIVHLYGQLDPLPWQEADGKEYSSDNNILDRLIAAPKNIKLMNNERDVEKSEYFQKAYRLIEDAKRIFFLGFSFDETNLGRLRLMPMKNSKQIFATVRGVDPTKLKWINDYFNPSALTNDITHENVDALTLLKNRLEIE